MASILLVGKGVENHLKAAFVQVVHSFLFSLHCFLGWFFGGFTNAAYG